MKQLKPHNLITVALVVLSCTFALRYMFLYPTASDSWTHLGIGRYVIDNHRLPTHEDISYKDTEPTLRWTSHSWLSDVLLYLTSVSGIPTSIVILDFPLLLLSLVILYLILQRLSLPPGIVAFSLSTAAVLAMTSWKLNPLLLAMPIFMGILLAYVLWRSGSRRAVWGIPLGLFLLANLWGGFIVIPFALLVIILIQEIILAVVNTVLKNPIALRQGKLQHLVMAFVVGCLATLANPNETKIWAYVGPIWIQLSTAKWYSSLSGTLVATNNNYFRNAPSPWFYTLFLIYALLLIIPAAVLTLRNFRGFWKEFGPVFALTLALALGFIWVRLIPLAVFLSMPAFSVTLNWLTKHLQKMQKISLVGYGLAGLALLGLLTLIVWPPRSIAFETPTVQIEFIQKYNLPDNILPSPILSGYLFWALYPKRGYLDAQDDLFDEMEAVSAYMPLTGIPTDYLDRIVERSNIHTVIADKNSDYLTTTLNNRPDWSLVYFDYNGFLFVKNDAVTPAFLEKHALSFIKLNRTAGVNAGDLSAAIAEMEQFTREFPTNRLALGQLASLYRFNGQADTAEMILRGIPQDQWDFIVLTEMGRIKAAEGQCKEAESWFLQALQDRSEKEYSRAVLDVAVLYAGCLDDKDKARHYFVRYNSFPIDPPERERAKRIAKQFGISLDPENSQGNK